MKKTKRILAKRLTSKWTLIRNMNFSLSSAKAENTKDEDVEMKEYNDKGKVKNESMPDHTRQKHTSEGTSDEEKKANTEEDDRNNGENCEIMMDPYKKNEVFLAINNFHLHSNANNSLCIVYSFKFKLYWIYKTNHYTK